MSFRLDRTAFHAGTHAETEAYHRAHQPVSLAERLRAAMYLNSVAYDFDLQQLSGWCTFSGGIKN